MEEREREGDNVESGQKPSRRAGTIGMKVRLKERLSEVGHERSAAHPYFGVSRGELLAHHLSSRLTLSARPITVSCRFISCSHAIRSSHQEDCFLLPPPVGFSATKRGRDWADTSPHRIKLPNSEPRPRHVESRGVQTSPEAHSPFVTPILQAERRHAQPHPRED